ncbi:hypothetical protein Pcinc_032282, partial [Petrolisthes cinctipes]
MKESVPSGILSHLALRLSPSTTLDTRHHNNEAANVSGSLCYE